MKKEKNRRVRVLGCPVDNLSLKETLQAIEEFIKSGRPHQHVVINADKVLKLRKDKKLKQIVESCDLINVDGQPIRWTAKLLGISFKERITGMDLMEELLELSSQKGYSVYFLGARKEIVREVVEIYTDKYPSLKVAGWRDGYWESDEEKKVVQDIKRTKPEIVFVAISSPKKEFFIREYMNEMQVPFSMGVGGSFDIIAGIKKRAPKWMQKYGLEWLFRLCQEPGRLWKRYLIGNPIFIWLVLKEFIKVRILVSHKGLED